MEIFKTVTVFGESIDLDHILIPLVCICVAWLLFNGISSLLGHRLRKMNNSMVQFIGNELSEISFITPLTTGLYLGLLIIDDANKTLLSVAYILFMISLGWEVFDVFIDGTNFVVGKLSDRAKDTADIMILRFLGRVLKAFVFAIGVIMILSNLGYNVNSLIAGLGITGIAVALAVQALLGDFISSISLIFDKPFKIGDFVIVGDNMGTVEKIGMRSTRIDAIDGEKLVIPNSELTKSTIKNYGLIQSRRAKHVLGVVYETTSAKLQSIPQLINSILHEHPKVSEEGYRTHLIGYGDFSINFELVFYIATETFDEFLDAQQEVLFAIHTLFQKEEIEFAYPTSRMFIEKNL